MAQKEVEDIFAKTMKKSQFKASSTLRLAKTFLSKNKVMTTWRAKDHMNALAEVEDDQDEEEKQQESENAVRPKKQATKITEAENSSVDRSLDAGDNSQ